MYDTEVFVAYNCANAIAEQRACYGLPFVYLSMFLLVADFFLEALAAFSSSSLLLLLLLLLLLVVLLLPLLLSLSLPLSLSLLESESELSDDELESSLSLVELSELLLLLLLLLLESLLFFFFFLAATKALQSPYTRALDLRKKMIKISEKSFFLTYFRCSSRPQLAWPQNRA